MLLEEISRELIFIKFAGMKVIIDPYAGFCFGVERAVNTALKTLENEEIVAVLAHEIGHHLQGHTLKAGGSDPQRELEADEFSGFVMYQMGASLKEAQSAIWRLTTDYDTGSHPPRSKRLNAIKKGYHDAKDLYPHIAGAFP